MNAPQRWLDAPREAPPGVTELLRDGLELEPDASQKDAIWAAISANVGPGSGGSEDDGGPDLQDPGAGAAGSAAAAKSSASALVATAAKSLLVGLLAGGVVATGYGALGRGFDEPPGATSPPAVTAPEAPAALGGAEQRGLDVAPALPAQVPTGDAPPPITREQTRAIAPPSVPGEPRAERPSGVSPSEPAPGDGAAAPAGSPGGDALVATPEEARRSRLREESALVGEARGALRAGNAGQALTLLESARTRFPDGILGQEREALTIEALARSGNAAVASARARAFLAAYPSSAHAERIQTFIGP
jgi:hypothetical protein